MPKLSKNLIPISIIVAGILIGGVIIYLNNQECLGEPSTEGQILSSQEAGEKAIDFVNQNILKERATASLIEAVEENGLYRITFDVQGNEIDTYITRDGELFFLEAVNLTEVEPVTDESYTIGNFLVTSEEICKEDGKPIVYFFGSESCSYCSWEHPIMEKVAAKFEGEISFHNNMDSDADMDVFSKYSTGGIPTLVLGCKYYRVGAGTQLGEEEEEERILTALVCKLAGNQPADVCQEIEDLINQVEG